ncbi:carbohydrate kinase [Motilimonas sp. 1_MG-2023]|uniref:carbohydrate kinase family protein n=1 Tax=Motilimonas sp. 1_MG-2023 TaxID=3062672 RepID=UPI0026E45EEC|nr:carbohydrate kinase [Motilimonas sp. 1_MG-2023]MDO6524765.1 carbohydrate kinase [Motilimonas sp. 1_MG-2023]
MARIITFGEILIDWIPLEFRPFGGLDIPVKGQFPGGAPANVAVAVARLGQMAQFVGAVGQDDAGEFLRQSLQKMDVNTDHLLTDPEHATPMAFVSLDEKGERSFSFARENTADLNFDPDYFAQGVFTGEGIFHICSNTLTHEGLFQTTLMGLQQAQQANFLTSFDVNLRLPLWRDPSRIKARVLDCISYCDIVKLSQDELEYLAAEEPTQAFIEDLLTLGPSLVLVTDADKPVSLYMADKTLTQVTPKVTVMDTTGAGDAFMGAWLYAMLAQNVCNPAALEQALNHDDVWQFALKTAVTGGGFAVTHQGAWSALPTLSDIQGL